jgi:purine-binding chemotaxis protein CheW
MHAVDHLDDEDDVRPRLLVVEVDGASYGIPITQVREVVRAGTVTRVPGAPALVRGIINVRGAVVTVLELSVLLGAERAVTGSSVVLLEHGARLIGLAVDVVRDVRVQQDPVGESSTLGTHATLATLDAVALCAPHLLSAEEMGR